MQTDEYFLQNDQPITLILVCNVSHLLGIMKVSSRSLFSLAMVIALIAGAIATIFLATNFTVTNAQQQQTSQSSVTQNPTLLQITRDSFRVGVPEGWVIHDVKNTGSALLSEVLQGYGVLAQLCPQEEQQAAVTDVGSGGGAGTYRGSCEDAREEIIHIIRYPNLSTRLGIDSDDIFTLINRDTIPNAILSYHMQKLVDVGYRDIQIVNNADTTIKVISTGPNSNRIATTITVPAKLVEITYGSPFAPNEISRGYFILTATAATPRNLGMITGYSIFHEGNSAAGTTTAPAGSLAPIPLPEPVRQVFDSFELVAASTDPLTSELISSDTEGIAPATFEFEADIAGGLEPFTYSWDFGDGSEESDDDETVEHTFDLAGTYNVAVVITDSAGRTAHDSILVTVEPPPPLTAVEIISSDTEGIAPATFEFEANVTGGLEPFTYSWDFGDGSEESDDDETVEHTFDLAGTYDVDLTVTDSTGANASDSILITVEAPPPPPPSPPPVTPAEEPPAEEPPAEEPPAEEPPAEEPPAEEPPAEEPL
jgi:PKD repeat protein